jgi:Flp pilus assembly protein TadG
MLRSFRRLLGDRRGIAATEFAVILPVMGLLFFGMMEGSDLLLVSRRLSNASNSLADLVSQQPQLTHSDVASIMTGMKNQLEPTDTSTLVMRVVSVIRDPSDPTKARVHWSRDHLGNTPYSAGSVYAKIDNPQSINSMASLIVVEFEYDYTSGLTSKVFHAPYEFSRQTKRWPRVSPRVQLCTNATPAVCTS